MGLSGSGKTTMLRVIAGLEPRDAGEVTAAKVGMVFQFHYLFEHLSAIDNVTLAPIQVFRVSVDEARQRAQSLLDQFGVGHRAGALPRELSGVKRSAWRSPAHSRSIRRYCCSTSRPHHSIRRAVTISATPCQGSPSLAAPW